ncbi:Pre-mRNA-splicing factor SYF2 [Knufia obscura]|uniref:Pre-mRNA-splicing factor SYF2 n=2 Tax=Knufia TaxID=430999 RepID=A0AAN8EI67_9EURO|nr:Pre-mRNA-splicing factor SYF2 [Knufia obscura]KAK5950190.1 Pre-mRNA-splicing factor SYF2 [Knufia fluminis]
MTPPAKKRRLSPPADEVTVPVATPSTIVKGVTGNESEGTKKIEKSSSRDTSPAGAAPTEPDQHLIKDANETASIPPIAGTAAPDPDAGTDRLARFAALKKRATQSARSNLSEAKAEAQRGAIDHTALANLSRRSAIAQHNLLKADTEEQGGTGAFERKRAWDYTIEESERWDERMAQKKEARQKNSFQDYGAEAAKIYDRQIRELEKAAQKEGGRNKDEYLRQKAELIEQAARSGGLEIVEMDNGELVAIDRDGRFYADQNNTGFVEQKPRKENVDRLVEDIRKSEEVRLKKRKDRRGDTDEGDVTYINEKNKQFNLKLARFYDRYTTDIRESFERGTAI